MLQLPLLRLSSVPSSCQFIMKAKGAGGNARSLLSLFLAIAGLCVFASAGSTSAPENASTGAAAFYTVWYDVDLDHYFVGAGEDLQNGVAVAEYADERNQNGWTR